MSTRPVVLAVCGDPGGAAAVAPVLRRLGSEHRVHVRSLAYAATTDALRTTGVPTHTLSPGLTDEDLARLLDGVALVFTGTSGFNAENYERRLASLAAARGLPTAAMVDFWSNHAGRFSLRDGSTAHPDRVFAVDETMRLGLLEAGVPAERVRVVGHPAFDAIVNAGGTLEPAARSRIRAAHGVKPGEKLVLFAANPIKPRGAPPGDDGSTAGQRDALESLAQALENVAAQRDLDIVLSIRPHPREPEPKVVPKARPRVRVRIGAEDDAREAVLACDALVGITTMLLIEGCLMRRPTIALRIGRADTHAHALPPFVPRARDAAGLTAWLDRVLSGEAPPDDDGIDHALLRGNATAEVMREIYALLEAPAVASDVQKAHREV